MKNHLGLPILLTMLFICTQKQSQARVHPLSKVTVTSNRALGKSSKAEKGLFTLQYQDNVVTTLADGSTIQADELTITIETGQNGDIGETIKNIQFNGNIFIKRLEQEVAARSGTIDPTKKSCRLRGNVSVKQYKNHGKDLPITLASEEAELSLESGEILFSGSVEHPVSTILQVPSVSFLERKKKKK